MSMSDCWEYYNCYQWICRDKVEEMGGQRNLTEDNVADVVLKLPKKYTVRKTDNAGKSNR